VRSAKPARYQQCGTNLFGRRCATVEGLSSLALLPGSLLSCLCHLAGATLALLDSLDDTDGNRLTHVTDCKAPEWSVLGEWLDAHRFLRHHLHDARVARFEVGRVVLDLLAATTIDLLEQVTELAGNVRRVTVEDWGVASVDLTRVIQNNHLRAQQAMQCQPTWLLK